VKAEVELVAARKALSSSPPKLDRCLTSLTTAINFSPQSEELRLLRDECALLSNDFDSAVADLSRASAISPALPTHLQLRISLLSSLFLDHGLSIPSDSLLALKKCLSADPDSKPCRKAFKALKSAEKDLSKLRNWLEADRWTEVAVTLAGSSTKDGLVKVVKDLISSYQTPLSKGDTATSPLPSSSTLSHSSPLLTALLSSLCHSYIALNTNSRKTAAACTEVLAHDPEDTWGLVGRSEVLMKEENWEEAVRLLSDAFEKTGRSDREVLSRLQKAQRLLKQSKQKVSSWTLLIARLACAHDPTKFPQDYYKILGVARDADAKTIKRA
jgi:DnaJ family protein C protein 3